MAFDPKDQLTSNQAKKVEELPVRGDDYDLYQSSVGTPSVVPDPNLPLAGKFAVLGASGVTNTGSSVLTGDLGSSPTGSISGFPPGTFSGALHSADSAAAAAQANASSVFTSMQTLGLAGTTIPSELGGQTLTPGAYKFASGSAGIGLTGTGTQTLTLNGAGTYIIYTASTLTTGASAGTAVPAIALAGGALAKNVFFIVGSSATINQNVASAGATFNGNIIAQANITDTSGGIVNGSLIALTGAVTLSAAAVINAQNGSSSSPTMDIVIPIRETVTQVYLAREKVDSSNLEVEISQSQISLIDSRLINISSIGTGNPSLVTTLLPHNLGNNDRITIVGSNSTPVIDGIQRVLYVVSPTSFLLPINVSGAGSAGALRKSVDDDRKDAIKLSSVPGSAFNPNDLITVKYSTKH